MRVAIVISSPYETGSQLASLAAWSDDTERLAERLSGADAGYSVEALSAERGLADQLEHAVGRCAADDELLIYFGGYAVLAAERGAALLLDGARPGALSLPKLRGALNGHRGSTLVVIDALAYLDPGKSWAEFESAVAGALSGGSVSVVVAARAPDQDASQPLVARALVAALDGLGKTSTQPVTTRDLCALLEADLPLQQHLDCFSHAPGALEAVVLPGAPARTAQVSARLVSASPPSSPELSPSVELPKPRPAAGLPPIEPRPTNGNGHAPSSFMALLTGGRASAAREESAPEPLPEPAPEPPPNDSHPPFVAPDDGEVTRVDHDLAHLREDSVPAPAPPESPAEQWSEPTPTHSDVFQRPSELGDDFDDATVPRLNVDDLVPPAASAQPDEPAPAAAVPEAPAEAVNVPSAMARGDDLMQSGDYQAAIDEYKRALVVFGSERSLLRAELYVRLGDAARALNRVAVALNNYDKALSIDATNPGAFESASELLLASRDYERLAEFQRRRSDALTDPGERAEALAQSAALWLDQVGDPERGVAALRRWLELVPDDRTALGKLYPVEHALGWHPEALESRLRLIEAHAAEPARQVELLVDTAEAAYETMNDAVQAVALAERALAIDPGSSDALAIATALLEHEQDTSRLARLLESVLARLHDGPAALEVALKLGQVRQAAGDAGGAIEAYERALRIDDGDPSLRLLLADLYVGLGELEPAAEQCLAAARALPRDADVFRRVRAVFEHGADRDRAWNAACVIDYLGEADVNESLAAAEHRPEGLIAAQSTLSDDDWTELLLPELEPELIQLLAGVAGAALELELPRLAKKRGLPPVQPDQRHDLEKSTITLGKSLLWTSRLIGVATPELYILPELEPPLAHVPGREPRCLASKALASGLGLPELAFLWARHLAFLRPELALLVAFPSPGELAELLAAVFAALGRAGKPPSGEAKRLASGLAKRLDAKRLAPLAESLPSHDAAELAARFVAVSELGCTRAGLVACGDLATALGLLERFPIGSRASQDEQIDRLLAYAVSRHYAELRRRLGVAVA